MAAKKNVHVVPRDDGWATQREGGQRASSLHKTQAEAVKAARPVARADGVELIVHRKDGTIGKRDSHGNDPYPPPG